MEDLCTSSPQQRRANDRIRPRLRQTNPFSLAVVTPKRHVELIPSVNSLWPRSKILFVSQENSGDVVRGALATGAKGYVLKIDAGRELLIAVNTVLRGEQFVSSGLSGFKDEHTRDYLQRKNATAPLP